METFTRSKVILEGTRVKKDTWPSINYYIINFRIYLILENSQYEFKNDPVYLQSAYIWSWMNHIGYMLTDSHISIKLTFNTSLWCYVTPTTNNFSLDKSSPNQHLFPLNDFTEIFQTMEVKCVALTLNVPHKLMKRSTTEHKDSAQPQFNGVEPYNYWSRLHN